jgi:hypothetical protein
LKGDEVLGRKASAGIISMKDEEVKEWLHAKIVPN